MKKALHKLLFLLLITYGSQSFAADLTWTSKAVVKLFVTQQAWDLRQPWTKHRARQGTCTGFFIREGILTNAHCVVDATFIEMEIPGHPDKIEVVRKAVNHQTDLALVEPAQPLDIDLPTITFGELPNLRDKVVTVGYPTGGRQVSYTEGVVSRIDVMRYVHSNINAPLVQTDAPINVGNSGGPVFSDATGECIGVATQKLSSGEGLGFFVPTPIIQQFLTDIKDGDVNGIPSLGTFFQSLENPAARKVLQMSDEQSGIRVRAIAKESTSDNVLETGDVLLSIDDHNIRNDGQVPFGELGKIWLGYHVAVKQVGESMHVEVLRDGEIKEIELELKPFRLTIVPRLPSYDVQPEYEILGGLLFTVVEQNYLWSWGRKWSDKIPTSLKLYTGKLFGEDDLRQLVVISEIYNASVNKGYGGAIENVRVVKINDKEIFQISDVHEAIQTPLENGYHAIELEGNIHITLDAEQVKEEETYIKQRYGIHKKAL